ncbi:MAG: hypothetical protein LBI70_02985 [Rickettsiales bacterium]|jgi:hypothetical protein|nr:hypothetical protein [Rickettsiales bacterium]
MKIITKWSHLLIVLLSLTFSNVKAGSNKNIGEAKIEIRFDNVSISDENIKYFSSSRPPCILCNPNGEPKICKECAIACAKCAAVCPGNEEEVPVNCVMERVEYEDEINISIEYIPSLPGNFFGNLNSNR